MPLWFRVNIYFSIRCFLSAGKRQSPAPARVFCNKNPQRREFFVSLAAGLCIRVIGADPIGRWCIAMCQSSCPLLSSYRLAFCCAVLAEDHSEHIAVCDKAVACYDRTLTLLFSAKAPAGTISRLPGCRFWPDNGHRPSDTGRCSLRCQRHTVHR